MGSFSIGHMLVVLAIVMILFGRGKISGFAKDIGEGIRHLRDATKDAQDAQAEIKTKIPYHVD